MAGFFADATFPIIRGPLAGKRWLVASRMNFFLGTYEPEQTQAFLNLLKPGDVVYDVGAHYGYYTLLASTLVGAAGKVVAFEPSPVNFVRLQNHVRINNCGNVTVEQYALADRTGKARFDNQTGSGTGHLAADGPLEVKTTSLDILSTRFSLPRVVKIDVEGAELEVLAGGENTIRSGMPSIFLSTHGEDVKQRCFNLLDSWGYEFSQLHHDDYLVVPRLRPFSG